MSDLAKLVAAVATASAVALCWGWGTAAERASLVRVWIDPVCGSESQARELISALRTRFPDRPVRRLRRMPEENVAIAWEVRGRIDTPAGPTARRDAAGTEGVGGADAGRRRADGTRRGGDGRAADVGVGSGSTDAGEGEAEPGERTASTEERASPGRRPSWRRREIFPPDMIVRDSRDRGDAGGCGLAVRGGAEARRLELPRDAQPEAVYRAAARAVWLLSDRSPLTPRAGRDAGGAEEPIDEIVSPRDWPTGDVGEATDRLHAETGRAETSGPADAGATAADAGMGRRDVDAGADGRSEGEEEPQWTDVEYQTMIFGPLRRPQYDAERVAPDYALNVIGTEYGLTGAEFGVLMNVHDGFAHGLQSAGLANYVGGEASGVQTSLGANVTDAQYEGVALTGGMNYADELEGFQGALGVNLVDEATEGLQAAVGVNWTGGRLDGLQSAVLNVGGDVNGAQLGVVNVGRDVEGAQVGLVNVARRSTVSLGLISVNWGRPLYVGLTHDVSGFAFLELEHGSQRVHHLLVVGVHPYNPRLTGSAGAGLGVDIGSKPLAVDLDLVGNFVAANAELGVATSVWTQMRATAVWSLFERFALTGGVSGNLLVGVGDPIVAAPTALPTSQVDRAAWVWPGVHAGVRF